MSNDYTSTLEQDIQKEHTPKMSFVLRAFLYVFSSAKAMCGLFLGLSVLLSIMYPIIAFVWRRYIDTAGLYADVNQVRWFSLVGLLLLYAALSYINHIIERFVYGQNFVEMLNVVQHHRLQEKFLVHLNRKTTNLHPEYLEVPKINDTIKRSFDAISGQDSPVQKGVLVGGYNIIAMTVSVIMITATLFVFSPILSVIILATPLPILYTTYFYKKMNFIFFRGTTPDMREAGYYQEILLGKSMKEIKSLNLFDFFFAKWKVIVDDYTEKSWSRMVRGFILNIINNLVFNIGSIGSQVFAIILLAQGHLSTGEFGAVFFLINILMGNASNLFRSIATFISKKNEAAQFFELIDLKEYETTPSESTEDIVHFNNVSYRYPLTDKYILDNINLKIREGEKVAFVGENGAGKTTTIKLITGMLEPSVGSIHVKSSNHRYDDLACVFQEPNQYNSFTVAENVSLGDINREDKDSAINAALDFVNFNHADKDALLGKDIGGTDLSGGEWQKLSIARAYYRNKDFYILDEPTSNLDPIVEMEIFKKYMEMAIGKTVIIVTHRISTAAMADRIVVFKDGCIVEDGTHKDLLSQNGEYTRLYSTQAQWYDRD